MCEQKKESCPILNKRQAERGQKQKKYWGLMEKIIYLKEENDTSMKITIIILEVLCN